MTLPGRALALGTGIDATWNPASLRIWVASALDFPMTVGTRCCFVELPLRRRKATTPAIASSTSARSARRPGVKKPFDSGGSSGGGGGAVPAAAATAAYDEVSPNAAPEG